MEVIDGHLQTRNGPVTHGREDIGDQTAIVRAPMDRAAVANLPAISTYGRFELLGRLAVGGMAEIYLARERSAVEGGGQRHLVLKRILQHVADDGNFVQMFFDEARLAMQLRHPSIVHIYEFGEADGSYFLAMEWVDGVPLTKLIRTARPHGGLPIPLVVKVIANTAEALHYAHHFRSDEGQVLNIVHRDVSPQNIMVSFDGTVKLLDFGIAKATLSHAKTGDGQVKGKFAYMSPQQCMGDPIDGRADIFSLGVVLWETLTGKPLFHRKTQYETMQAVVEGVAPSALEHRPEIGEDLAAIVAKALAPNVEDRYPTAGDMQMALEHWLAMHAEVVPAPRIAMYLDGLFSSPTGHGAPVVDSTPFGQSFQSRRPQPPVSEPPIVDAKLLPGSGPKATVPMALPPGANEIIIEEADDEAPTIAMPSMSAADVDAALGQAPKKKRRWLIPLALLLLLLGAGGVFFATQTPGSNIAIAPVAVGTGEPGSMAATVPGSEAAGPEEGSAQDSSAPEASAPEANAQDPDSQGSQNGEQPVGPAVQAQPGENPTQPAGETVPDAPEPSELPEGRQAPSLAQLRVQSTPPGELFIDDTSVGSTPYAGELRPGTHTLRVSASGYRSWREAVTVEAGDTEDFHARLRSRSSESPATMSAMTATASSAMTATEAPMEAEMVERPAATPGQLSVNTRPWSQVYLGNRNLGTTPIGGVSLPAGTHRLRLVDRDGNEHRRSVTVEAGEHARTFFDLRGN